MCVCSQILISKSASEQWEVTGGPFNAMVQGAKKARDMTWGAHLTGAAVEGMHPWFAPRDFVCEDPGMKPGGAGSWL